MKAIKIAVLFIAAIQYSFAQSSAMNDTIKYYVPPIKGLKSETAAVFWSIGTTLVPSGVGSLLIGLGEQEIGIGMIIGGLVIGPSAGHFYAKQSGRGFVGIGLRTVIGGTAALLALSAVTAGGEAYNTAGPLSLIGFGATLGVICWDIASVPASVRKYNEQLNIQIKPEINLKEKKYGIGFVYRF